MALSTPIALFIFNRPDLTAQVFARIRDARPQTLLIVADAARVGLEGEARRCEEAKQIVSSVDWPCTLLTNISPSNLGCRVRISSGLDWVFSCVESAIILEDDCVPSPSFFAFCDELLLRYKDDERVMMIAGHINHFGKHRETCDYYFSRMPHIWGWATWRRAWRYYDVNMTMWPAVAARGWLKDIFRNAAAEHYWSETLWRTYRREIDTWDYQWMLACWLQGGLSINPAENLVSNIGFRADATHTTGFSRFAGLKAKTIPAPLIHPSYVLCDEELSVLAQKTFHQPLGFPTKVIDRLRRIAGNSK